jgi:hypothetical protein
MRNKDGQEMEEEMQEEIRNWFFEDRFALKWIYILYSYMYMYISRTCISRDDQGKFPDYPSDDEGGSAAIFNPERFNLNGNGGSPEEADLTAAKKERKSEGDERKKSGKESSAAAAVAAAAAASAGEAAEDEVGFTLKSTDFVRHLRSGQKTFNGICAHLQVK